MMDCLFFFFSSRRRHTRWNCDWSSDVCSSDLNGDDPEAVVRTARLAFAYRQAFKKDVVVDMICYRKRGHNETDNPSFTQPLMYDLVEAKRSTRKVYTESLIARGDISMEEAEGALRDYQQQLERVFTETRDAADRPPEPGSVIRPEPERSEEHTSELQSQFHLVCRLLLEK